MLQNDAATALKRARQQYIQRCEELEKAKAMTAKGMEEAGGSKTLDKRRKSRDDAQTKASVCVAFPVFRGQRISVKTLIKSVS